MTSALADIAQSPAAARTVCVFANSSDEALALAQPVGARLHRLTSAINPTGRVESLEAYLPDNWEHQLLETFGELARVWPSAVNSAMERLQFGDINLAEAGQYSFITRIIHEKGRTLMAVDAALRALQPDEVFTDSGLYHYVRAAFDGPVHLLPGEVVPAEGPGLVHLLREAFTGVAYKLGFTTVLSRVLQLSRGERPPAGEPVFVGAEHGLKNLEVFFAKQDRPIRVFRPGGRLWLNRGLASSGIRWSITFMEGLLPWRDCFAALWQAGLLAIALLAGLRAGRFASMFRWRGRNCFALFWPEFVRFLLVYSPGAIKHAYLARHIVQRCRPARVFFDNPDSWDFSAMIAVFRAAGVPTTGYVNGMVQDLIPFRCAVDTMLVSGEYDRRLLEPVLGARSSVSYGYLQPAAITGQKRNLLIISSTGRHLDERVSFLRLVLAFVASHVDPRSYHEIVLKLHPYERAADFDPVLADFAGLRFRATRADLQQEIANARLAFCLLSTVLLDLLSAGVPFLLYDSISWPRHTFYKEIPASLKFTTLEELRERMQLADRQQHDREALRTRYYGNAALPTERILGQHLLGSGE